MLEGFVIAVLEIDPALRAALAPLVPEDVRLEVVIESGGREGHAVRLDPHQGLASAARVGPIEDSDRRQVSEHFELAGLTWRIKTESGPGFPSGRAGLLGWLLLALGLSLTGLFSRRRPAG